MTPQGRIISRFTRDMRSIDGEFTELTSMVLDMGITLVVKLAGITFVVPWFSAAGLILILFGSAIAELCTYLNLTSSPGDKEVALTFRPSSRAHLSTPPPPPLSPVVLVQTSTLNSPARER